MAVMEVMGVMEVMRLMGVMEVTVVMEVMEVIMVMKVIELMMVREVMVLVAVGSLQWRELWRPVITWVPIYSEVHLLLCFSGQADPGINHFVLEQGGGITVSWTFNFPKGP